MIPLTKPPPWSRVNPGHPLAPKNAWLFGEGAGSLAMDAAAAAPKNAPNPGTARWYGNDRGRTCTGGFSGASDYFNTGITWVAAHTWVGRFKMAYNGTFQNLVSTTGGGGYVLYLWNGTTFSLWTSGEASGSNIGSAVTDGAWTTFAFSRAGNSVTNGYSMYYNGALSGQLNAATQTAPSGPWVIGNRQDAAQPWLGLVDYMYYYDRQLTADEVLRLYTDPFQAFDRPAAEPLVGPVAAAAAAAPFLPAFAPGF